MLLQFTPANLFNQLLCVRISIFNRSDPKCLIYLLQTTFIDWKTDFDQKILSKKKLTTAIVDVSNGSQSVCDNPFIPYATVINTIVFLLRKFQVR